MLNLERKVEKAILVALKALMLLVITVGTVELGWTLIVDLFTPAPPGLVLDIKELLEIFGKFLLVLIGIELMETIRAYHEENAVRVEVVMIAAITAVCREIIILDYKALSAWLLGGLAALLLVLVVGYYFLRRCREASCRQDRVFTAES